MAKNKKGRKSHGKHCNSKAEVLNMVARQMEQKQPERPKNSMNQRLQTVNKIRYAMERAKQEMREQEGSGNDTGNHTEGH
jgi:hypothetical protein